MNPDFLKKTLPTLMTFLERRRHAAKNQLPKHLRPRPLWPIAVQIFLNITILLTLITLMINRDEFITEAAPAIGLVVCLLLLIYTLISAVQLKQRYRKAPGVRWAKANMWVMGVAAFLFPISVAYFLP